MRISVVGVDHHVAGAEVRSRLHLDATATSALLGRIRGTFPGCQALVLSTCNRTELWFVEEDGRRAADAWHLLLGEHAGHGAAPCGDVAVARRHLEGPAAVEHVVRVAAGLDSAVLGDVEVLGQIRAARAAAVEAGVVGKHLHRLVEMALATGKLVRTRTSISAGGAGIGSAATSLVASRVTPDDRVLVVGAGVIARNVVLGLGTRGFRHLRILNRTRVHAERLGAPVGASVAAHDSLVEEMAAAAAVVVAVSGVTIGAEDLAAVARRRGGASRLLLVDASLPRVVADHPAMDVATVDGIAAHRDRLLSRRERAVGEATSLALAGVQDFLHWLAGTDLDDDIAALYAAADRTVRRVAEVHGPERAETTRRALRRELHLEVTRRRAVARSGSLA